MNPYDEANPLLDPVRPYFGWFGDDEEEDIFGRTTLPAFLPSARVGGTTSRVPGRLERPARGISRAGRSADTESEAA